MKSDDRFSECRVPMPLSPSRPIIWRGTTLAETRFRERVQGTGAGDEPISSVDRVLGGQLGVCPVRVDHADAVDVSSVHAVADRCARRWLATIDPDRDAVGGETHPQQWS